MLNLTETDKLIHEAGDAHRSLSKETPLRIDAFELDDNHKIEQIEQKFREIMHLLGLDLTDESLRGTPRRVAKMYVKELFSGLKPENRPEATLFTNSYHYHEMLVEKDIAFFSTCEHHFVPIVGRAHVAYIPQGQVVGLSKINRLVDYFARRPQVQERLTMQIANELVKTLNTPHVAVVIEATHLCVAGRGIKDQSSKTITAEYTGRFEEEATRSEFLSYLHAGQ